MGKSPLVLVLWCDFLDIPNPSTKYVAIEQSWGAEDKETVACFVTRIPAHKCIVCLTVLHYSMLRKKRFHIIKSNSLHSELVYPCKLTCRYNFRMVKLCQ